MSPLRVELWQVSVHGAAHQWITITEQVGCYAPEGYLYSVWGAFFLVLIFFFCDAVSHSRWVMSHHHQDGGICLQKYASHL
jgi:hypothetical protein